MGVYRFGDRVIDPQKYPWGYGYRLRVTIDSTKIDSNLTHFPLPIPLGSSVGTNNFNTQRVFDEIGSDYQKLRVTDSDGNDLYVEVEQWDAVNKKGLIWVSRDTWTISSTSDSRIFIIPSVKNNSTFVGTPGNRTEMWNSDFAAVFTMAQDPTGGADCIIDSTGNGNHGTPSGSMTSGDLIDGQIGKAIDFDGGDDTIQVAHDPSILFGTGDFTISFWEKPDTSERNDNVRFDKGGVSGSGSIYFYDAGSKYRLRINGSDVFEAFVLSVDTWAFITITRIGDIIYFYIDAVEQGNFSGWGSVDINSGNDLFFGSEGNSSRYYDGALDNMRWSTLARSAAWTKADYHAQTDNLLTFE